MNSQKYIENQVDYFKKNGKENPHLLGVEFEHFLVDRQTLRSYSYFEPNGQKDIFTGLIQRGWQLTSEENGYPLALEKKGHHLTFEPGGQIELSLGAVNSLEEVDLAYREVMGDVLKELRPNQSIVSLGYHPLTKIGELPLLPKKRYEMMYEYFKNHGALCHHMMKGTAATQVSVDYRDEDDFVKKFRVAHFIAPVLAQLFDATPVFNGEIYPYQNARVAIWQETDIKRSKLIPGVMDTRFDFKSYAEYLLKMEPILIRNGGKDIYMGEQALESFVDDFVWSDSDLEHIQSMVFPDARLKRYIEIRMADALPYPYSLAVPALIKGIFYSDEAVNVLYQMSLAYKDQWVKDQNHRLVQPFVEKDEKFDDLFKCVLEYALKGLDSSEKKYLEMFLEKVSTYGSMATFLKTEHAKGREDFLKAIELDLSSNEKGK